MRVRLIIAGLTVLLQSCATDIPVSVRDAPKSQPRVADVRQATDKYVGTRVRWGGEIISVRNGVDDTTVEILARRLGVSGKPLIEGEPDARFLARIPGFLDPADYQAGQRLTVSGKILTQQDRMIGDYRYHYPVVRVDDFYRWPAVDPVNYPQDPYWDRYGPWWPYHRYPW